MRSDFDTGLLYIHPYGHPDDTQVPIGLVGVMNLVDVPKLGRFAHEVTREEVERATCIALDLHWYFPLAVLKGLLRAIRRVNPSAPIVLGGITASFFARQLMASLPLDYLVQGDAEPAFPELVRHLTRGRVPPGLPNVHTRKGPPPSFRPVPASTYDGLDYLTLDWFPSFERSVFSEHDRYAVSPRRDMDNHHPFLPLNRGCIHACDYCFGAYQEAVFCGRQIDRSPESFGRILASLERHPRYRFVNIFCGTEDASRIDGYGEVFRRRYDLGCSFMFCDLPTPGQLEGIARAFNRCCFQFVNPAEMPGPQHKRGWRLEEANRRLLEILEEVEGQPSCSAIVSFVSHKPSRLKTTIGKSGWESVRIQDNREWLLPRPRADRRCTPKSDARQAERLARFSRRMIHHALGRALAPALHPILDSHGLQDRSRRWSLGAGAGELHAFSRWFTGSCRRMRVPSLEGIRVDVWLATSGSWKLRGLDARLVPEDSTILEKGTMSLRYGLNGVHLQWEGSAVLPGQAGGSGLCIVPRLRYGNRRWLDLGRFDELPRIVVPVPAGRPGDSPARLKLDVRLMRSMLKLEVSVNSRITLDHTMGIRDLKPSSRLFHTEADAGNLQEPAEAIGNLTGRPFPGGPPDDLLQAIGQSEGRGWFRPWKLERQWVDPEWIGLEFSLAALGRIWIFVLPAGAPAFFERSARFDLVYKVLCDAGEGQREVSALLSRWAQLLHRFDPA